MAEELNQTKPEHAKTFAAEGTVYWLLVNAILLVYLTFAVAVAAEKRPVSGPGGDQARARGDGELPGAHVLGDGPSPRRGREEGDLARPSEDVAEL